MNAAGTRYVLLACLAIALFAGSLAGCTPLASSVASPAADARGEGGDWFVKTGCTTCHSVTAHGIWNVAATAPDLSIAVEDVPKRFGRSLEDFFQSPTGTMSIVLSSQIRLTDEERAVAVTKLKEAYTRHQENNGAIPVVSH